MNKILKTTAVILPNYDDTKDMCEREIVSIFIQRYRDLDLSRNDVRVTHAISKTADLSGYSDGIVTKILVDNGLRVSRRSLPQQFLDHIDTLGMRYRSRSSYESLKEFWVQEGEDCFFFLRPMPKRNYVIS